MFFSQIIVVNKRINGNLCCPNTMHGINKTLFLLLNQWMNEWMYIVTIFLLFLLLFLVHWTFLVFDVFCIIVIIVITSMKVSQSITAMHYNVQYNNNTMASMRSDRFHGIVLIVLLCYLVSCMDLLWYTLLCMV